MCISPVPQVIQIGKEKLLLHQIYQVIVNIAQKHYFLNKPKGECAQFCATGYSDDVNGLTANNPLEGNCQFCAPNYYLNKPNGECAQTCAKGYSDVYGQTPSYPLTGSCSHCAPTYFVNKPNGECS